MNTRPTILKENHLWIHWRKVLCLSYVVLLIGKQMNWWTTFTSIYFVFFADGIPRNINILCAMFLLHLYNVPCTSGFKSCWRNRHMKMQLLWSLQFWGNNVLNPSSTLSNILSHSLAARSISQKKNKQSKPRQGDSTDHGDLGCFGDDPEHADYFDRGHELEMLQLQPPCKRLAVGHPPSRPVSHSDQVPWPSFQL